MCWIVSVAWPASMRDSQPRGWIVVCTGDGITLPMVTRWMMLSLTLAGGASVALTMSGQDGVGRKRSNFNATYKNGNRS